MEYKPLKNFIWLLLRPWILFPRLIYLSLTILFFLIRLIFQGSSKEPKSSKWWVAVDAPRRSVEILHNIAYADARAGLGARDARTRIAAAACHELVVGGEVLRPRCPRDREDRREVEGVHTTELLLVIVAREDEAQERAAQGLGAELVHGCCWCCATKSGSFCGAFAGVAQECRVRRPRPGVRQQCGREVDAWGSFWSICCKKMG